MAKLEAVGRHPENLIDNRTYRIQKTGLVAPTMILVTEGVFKGLTIIAIGDKSALGILIKEEGKNLPQAIAWARVTVVEEIVSIRKRKGS